MTGHLLRTAARPLVGLGLAACALLVVTTLVLGAPAPPLQVRVNGRVVPFEVPLVEKDGQVMAPVQGLCDALGALVNYDDFTHAVKAFKGKRLVLLQVGNQMGTVNLKTHHLPVAPYVQGGQVMVPLRFVAEGLGGQVYHDQDHGMLDIRIADTEPVQIPRFPIPGRTSDPFPRSTPSPMPSGAPSPRYPASPTPRPGLSPVASPSPSGAPSGRPAPSAVTILDFRHNATTPLHSGDTLHVTLAGTPRGRAAFFIEGLAEDLPMVEGIPGQYAGDYRIPEGVRLQKARVHGTLQVGTEKAPLVTSPTLVTIEPLRVCLDRPEPAAGSVTKNRTPRITAFFETQGGPIVVRSVKIKVNTIDVTAKAYVTRQFFTYTPDAPLPVGRVRVEVEAEVEHRAPLRDGWDFEVR